MMALDFKVCPLRSDEAVCHDDRNTREYLAGVRKLRAWHEECRRKRNGTFVPSLDTPHVKDQGRRPKATKGGVR